MINNVNIAASGSSDWTSVKNVLTAIDINHSHTSQVQRVNEAIDKGQRNTSPQ